ncbi:MAG: alanine--tRNA ligase [Acidimicrobiia bacterium]
MTAPRTADELRAAFTGFFADRGHTVVPSASLIPHDPTVMLTIAGMLPFKPYFTGDEVPPSTRLTSVQKVARAGGKDSDIENVGRTNRHFSFFEMLGNFSFGDYFKDEVIPWAWELVTDVFELDPERLWVTVHESDDEAERIWTEVVGVPLERVQRMGADNWWGPAGDSGPTGPSSEIFYDLGPEHGADGGPAKDDDRYVEIWNLVFMQFDAQTDGSMRPLPKPSIDTGAGLERNLAAVQGVSSAWETDLLLPLVEAAAAATGTTYGGWPGGERDLWLRILADHGRTMTFLVTDGVVPSNEGRGYVLRRIIRRAVRHAYLLGAQQLVMPSIVDAVVATMSAAYPDLVTQHELARAVISREEERFRQTLARGLDLLDGILASGDVSGDDAFFLHDTLGFPIDLTREIAEERGHGVDLDAFERLMAEQRTRAREAHAAAGGKGKDAPVELYRELLDESGPTEFTGRQEYDTAGTVVRALIVGGERVTQVSAGDPVDVVLDRTPFYAESGGQVGDTGTLVVASDDGAIVRVTDTQYGLPGLVLHRGNVEAGAIHDGDEVTASIDGPRRDAIRRNHTATHILHWALREVLGTHVKQAGSFVSPEYLRFDFSHHEALTQAQLDEIEALANHEIISDAPVRHYETTKAEAEQLGAIAFFGDKYGDLVRVLEAGEHSIELCGGTHVHALGFIGPIRIVSEGSIGSNLRRIQAVTGDAALERIHADEVQLRELALALKVAPGELTDRVTRLADQVKTLQAELAAERRKQAGAEAAELVAGAADGVVVARRDGLPPDELRQLAIATREALARTDGTTGGVVALLGLGPDGTKAGVVAAVTKELAAAGGSAADVARDAARALGGGTGKQADIAVGGGPNVAAIDEALALLEQAARGVAGSA